MEIGKSMDLGSKFQKMQEGSMWWILRNSFSPYSGLLLYKNFRSSSLTPRLDLGNNGTTYSWGKR